MHDRCWSALRFYDDRPVRLLAQASYTENAAVVDRYVAAHAIRPLGRHFHTAVCWAALHETFCATIGSKEGRQLAMVHRLLLRNLSADRPPLRCSLAVGVDWEARPMRQLAYILWRELGLV